MSINRSGFYKWKQRLSNPSAKLIQRTDNINLFKSYHEEYPSHGYRWLNAMIRNETGVVMSDQYAHQCCKYAGITSVSKHYRYQKPGDPFKVYPNMLLTGLNVVRPMEVVVSDMTAFWCQSVYYELTLYMDLWNNEIAAFALSSKKGDRETYMDGLKDLIEKKKEYPNLKLILHTDQGSVYSSKTFNEILPLYNIIHSMSRAGTPTDNGAMEAINGWIKTELFIDFTIKDSENVEQSIKDYIVYFNEKRPAYSLNYLTLNNTRSLIKP